MSTTSWSSTVIATAFGFAFFSRLRFELFFLDDDDRSENRFRRLVDFDSASEFNVRNVNRFADVQVRNIDFDRIRNVRRIDQNFDFMQRLIQNRAFLGQSRRFADDVNRNGQFEFFAFRDAA